MYFVRLKALVCVCIRHCAAASSGYRGMHLKSITMRLAIWAASLEGIFKQNWTSQTTELRTHFLMRESARCFYYHHALFFFFWCVCVSQYVQENYCIHRSTPATVWLSESLHLAHTQLLFPQTKQNTHLDLSSSRPDARYIINIIAFFLFLFGFKSSRKCGTD